LHVLSVGITIKIVRPAFWW